MRAPVVFLRGLHTQGKDYLSFGPFGRFLVYGPLQSEIGKVRSFLPLQNIIAGTIEETKTQVAQLIRDQLELLPSTQKIHLLGHSMGGLIARAIVHEPTLYDRVLSVTTIAAPHLGSPIAKLATELEHSHPHVQNLICNLGYDIRAKKKYFMDLHAEAMAMFNLIYKDRPGINYASLVTAVPPGEWILPYYLVQKILQPFREEADGLVEVSSQHWGNVLGRFDLDHVSGLGIFSMKTPWVRKRHELEFRKMVAVLLDHWESLD